jgi:multicomponent K+:H+ antiporter subunit F
MNLAIDLGILAFALAMLMNLVRLLRGPDAGDRVLALDTMYVNAMALLILFGMKLRTPMYFEAALIIAMLGFVSTVVLAKFIARRDIME